MYLCEIQTETFCVGALYTLLNQRRGVIISEEPVTGTPLTVIKSYLPVAESIGFTQKLREVTSGRAFPQCVFDHWETMTSDVFQEGSRTAQVVEQIRKRKGLNVAIPALDEFLDRL